MATIAVINDDMTFLDLMHDLLTDEGHGVICWLARDGAQAMLRRERPALVLLDVRMDQPEDGLLVLREMRADAATASMPVIVCTGDHRFLQQHGAALRELRCAVLEKPFGLDELLAMIAAMLDAPSAACG